VPSVSSYRAKEDIGIGVGITSIYGVVRTRVRQERPGANLFRQLVGGENHGN
jgi:hypothetical protein